MHNFFPKTFVNKSILKSMKIFRSTLVFAFLVFALQLNIKAQRFSFADTLVNPGDTCIIHLRYYCSPDPYLGYRPLDSLVSIIKKNKVCVKIREQTDFRGSDSSNYQLTLKRLNGIHEYLLIKGIPEAWIQSEACGERCPRKVDAALAKKYSFLGQGQVLNKEYIMSFKNNKEREFCHFFNRRTEIIIQYKYPSGRKIFPKELAAKHHDYFVLDEPFILAKADFSPQLKTELDKIAEFLLQNPSDIEIQCFPDLQDSLAIQSYSLSKRRANAIKLYLIKRGIPAAYLHVSSCDFALPRIVDVDLVKEFPFLTTGDLLSAAYISQLKSEKQRRIVHGLNRRTELVIMERKKQYYRFSLNDKTIHVGDSCYLDVIFNRSRWGVIEESKPILDSLAELMLKHQLRIEIQVNTDCRDTKERNDTLSMRRARLIRDYLIVKGVPYMWIQIRGNGERVPRKVDKATANRYPFLSEGQLLSEDFIKSRKSREEINRCHKLNRRTLVIVKEII